MKYIMKVRFCVDRGNEKISDPKFGEKMHELLGEIKAEVAYMGRKMIISPFCFVPYGTKDKVLTLILPTSCS